MSLRDFSLVRFSVFVSSVKSEQMRPDIHHSFHSRLIVRRDGRPIFFRGDTSKRSDFDFRVHAYFIPRARAWGSEHICVTRDFMVMLVS